MLSSLGITAIAALGTGLLVPALARVLGPRGWMDLPSLRKSHGQPVPRVGGVALLLVLLVAKALGVLHLGLTHLEWAVIAGMGAVGILDDRFNLRARWKAMAGLLVAVPLAFVHTQELLVSGMNVTLFGLDIPDHPLVFFPLLTLWYWGVPNAFNLIDGLNGLSLGFSCALLAALGLGPASHIGSGAAPLLGALVALLALNYPKARHFMGDAGSLALGSLFAILVMEQALPVHRGLGLWLMAYPILDVTTVVAIRKYCGRPLGQADRSHLHHWLLERFGGRAWLVTPVLVGLAALPMTRDLPWAHARTISFLGFGVLVILAVRVFIDRAILNPSSAFVPRKEPRHAFLNEASGTHQQAS
ncbi:glycosyltransferase family 4 protein [Geothrix alkalitolerans]|uniref:glycosyltransferase family 4 protein n=1 Tax=Geothrix alkalitolerans TaxID=2922724 RepID=UPI001FAF6783|nr:MraY family glycosyltransferase [Geothrix alkalitolerans]